jgi:exosortase
VAGGQILNAALMQGLISLLWLSPAFLAVAWVVSRAQWFWNHNPDLQFGWIVLLLCAYLFWEAWEKRPALNWRWRPWAGACVALGLGVMFLVQIYQAVMGASAPTTLGLALGGLLVAAGNLGLVYGTAGVRCFGMAFGFLLIAMPMPSGIQGPVVGALQDKVAWFNTEVLNLMGIPATQVGSLIHLPAGTVGVDEACSGIRSLQSTIMATIFIGYLTLNRFSLQVMLFACGIGLAILGNLIRSLYLSLTANARGIEAIAGVHDAAGWSILTFTAVGVLILSWFFKKLERQMDRLEAEAKTASPEPPQPAPAA